MYAEATVIYADILFIINFSLDYLCLFITSRLMNTGGKILRMVVASITGGAYAFLPYTAELPVYISLPLDLITAAVLCLIAFGRYNIKKFLLIWGSYIVSSALLGGLITAIYSLCGRYYDGIYTEVGALSFGLICLFSAIIALCYGLICKKKIHTPTVEIRFFIGNEKFRSRLIADSGNLVTEPFSALPVIILSASALPSPYDDPESPLFPLQIRAIPFSTSAGKDCFFGFRPDRLEIIRLGKKPARADAYIAIDTRGNSYSGYDGLIPTSIL